MRKSTSTIKIAAAALSLCVSLVFTASGATAGQQTNRIDPDIRLNQAGYYAQSRKIAVVITNANNASATEFSVVRLSTGREVLKGRLSAPTRWAESGETGRQIDFSIVDLPGQYKIVLNDRNKSESYMFRVSEDIYRDVARASMRTYYFQRCSQELTERHAGKRWARAAGHPDTAVTFHVSSGRGIDTSINANDGTDSNTENDGTAPAPAPAKLRSPGGWYDAGDFGKYVVNSGISVATLMAFYENFPAYFPDRSLNIPESGNNIPDILDEIKVNLDWMKTMQDENGGVYFKLTTLTFPGYIMPADDKGERFAIGKSTTSALNFAAAMAMAARVYAPFDRVYAGDCLIRAVRAWDWAVAHPNVPFKNPPDVKTGEYSDVTFDDEFIWAASELLVTTGEKRYADFLRGKDIMYKGEPSWQNVHGLAALSLSVSKNALPASTRDSVRASVVKQADTWLEQMNKHPYRLPNINFIWGSNSIAANMGIGMLYAHKITGDRKYLLGAVDIADYLMGKNAIGISFMTGFGTRYAANPHHRQVVATTGIYNMSPADQEKRQVIIPSDDVVIPGFLVGGPNRGQQDKQHGVVYRHTHPAKSFEDVYKSYASNEVAINWNAPATFLFGAVDALMNGAAAPEHQQWRGATQPPPQRRR